MATGPGAELLHPEQPVYLVPREEARLWRLRLYVSWAEAKEANYL